MNRLSFKYLDKTTTRITIHWKKYQDEIIYLFPQYFIFLLKRSQLGSLSAFSILFTFLKFLHSMLQITLRVFILHLFQIHCSFSVLRCGLSDGKLTTEVCEAELSEWSRAEICWCRCHSSWSSDTHGSTLATDNYLRLSGVEQVR